jgi:putative MFS transporter
MQSPVSISARPEMSFGRAAIGALAVSALGYFVDIYDLILFFMLRVKSLRALGVPDTELLNQGIRLINWQMGGMLIGGIIWGVLGDKRGRLSVLFGSILLYSIANIANAFITTIPAYAALRFVAGIGLAGELGAGITLVSETLPKHIRGMGTSFVAGFGILGAVVAYLVGAKFVWTTAYIVGGIMGLVLLVLRVGVFESAMFRKLAAPPRDRGNFFRLFTEKRRAIKYVSIIVLGLPIWFTVSILMGLSPEIGKAMGMSEAPDPGRAVLFCYIGLAISDVASGIISAALKSRKKTVFGFLAVTLAAMSAYFFVRPEHVSSFYGICFALGIGCGYWAMFVTIAAEQFGTNLRATATTTVPNFVRGAVTLLTLIFQAAKPTLGVVGSAETVGYTTLAVAFVAALLLEETYGKDLDYVE